ncbi:GNAT family N-acetyltransferase [Deltaproteobacteria bacterium IMCC39524]|nr:GNAT family N-acetyltransferase [Deltaproteobacteria bacterium IMCC39524]
MILLNKNKYLKVLDVYRKNELFFPLVAAVLQETQGGVVYADSAETPGQFYVEHSFGFAQVFGEPNPSFEQNLEAYLLREGRFHASKVRLYAPYVPGFLLVENDKVSLSTRQRFALDKMQMTSEDILTAMPHRGDISCVGASQTNIALIDEKFGVVTRFWGSPAEFIAKSNMVAVMFKGEAAAICYSAATADSFAEIDVMTLPEFRKLGLAKLAVCGFVEHCFNQNISPLWDCFTNNAPSMLLAESVGYSPVGKPYSFYTINR